MPVHSIDNLVSAVEVQKLDALAGNAPAPDVVPDEPREIPKEIPKEELELSHKSDDVSPSKETSAEQPPDSPSSAVEKQEVKESEPEVATSDTHDAYGNSVTKKPQRTYTEEEVQNMIRDRLKRGEHAQQQTQQAQQQVAKDFTPDPNSTDTWEVQLENFVENTIQKREQKALAAQQRAHAEQIQSQFEEKFNNGMERYPDFKSVVSGKPITDAMMMAARSMDDPAAFIYAASKNHAKELDNIARMTDPYAQVAAVGRLEEQMKKVRMQSKAPPPVKTVKGDIADGKPLTPKRNIDDMIRQHANSRVRR